MKIHDDFNRFDCGRFKEAIKNLGELSEIKKQKWVDDFDSMNESLALPSYDPFPMVEIDSHVESSCAEVDSVEEWAAE